MDHLRRILDRDRYRFIPQMQDDEETGDLLQHSSDDDDDHHHHPDPT